MKAAAKQNLKKTLGIFLLILFLSSGVTICIQFQHNNHRYQAEEMLELWKQTILLELYQSINITNQLEAMIIAENGNASGFENLAPHLVEKSGVVYIELLENNTITHIYPEEYYSYIGTEYGKDVYSYHLSLFTKELVVSGPVELKNNAGTGYLFISPVILQKQNSSDMWGEVSIAVTEDYVMQSLHLNELDKYGYYYELWQTDIKDGEKQIITSNSPSGVFSEPVEIKFRLPTVWTMSIVPKQGWINRFFLCGLIASAIIIFSVIISFAFLIKQNRMIQTLKRKMDYQDLETGLPNRAGLLEKLCEWTSSNSSPFALLYITVQNFSRALQLAKDKESKLIIKHICSVLDDYIKQTHFIARVGEQNFVLAIQTKLSDNEIQDIQKGLSVELEQSIMIDGEKNYLIPQFGVSQYPDDGRELTFLLHLAAKRYDSHLKKNDPILDIIQKCNQMLHGNDNIVFGYYADRNLNLLARILDRYRKRAEQAFYEDSLLRIGNRMKCLRDIEYMITQDEQRPFSLIVIDIKEFNKYNELFSVEVGDILLREICHRISAIFQNRFYRIGGDIFLGILIEENMENRLLTDMQEILSQKFVINNTELLLQFNIGICRYPEHGISAADLLEKGQVALRFAKNDPGHSIKAYNETLTKAVLQDEKILRLLQKRIAEDSVEVWYQPIYYVKEQAFLKAEALLRLQDNNGNYIPPDLVIPLAEKNQMTEELGACVLRTACAAVGEIQRSLGDSSGFMQMQVNLSVQQLMVKNYARKILAIIDEMGVSPEQIALEITESMLIQSFDNTVEILNELKWAGIHIILDDFGSGYSNMSYLANLPIDTLKLDMSLTRQVTASSKQFEFIKAVVQMAKSGGMRVVAEGVETQEELDCICQTGVDAIQGYYYSKPMSKTKFIQFLHEHSSRILLNPSST